MSAHHDIGHTLFTAKSSAHVYELLHAERSDGFNVFLKTESEAPVTETLTAQAPK
jgi:hypothetical protein